MVEHELLYFSNEDTPCLPSEGDLDGCSEAGGEEVGREVGVHGKQLAGLAGSQLDAVLHGWGEGHLCQRVARIDRCHLEGEEMLAFIFISFLLQ